MYNGIGLSTVRGSGTSGYVQRNLSHVPATKERKKIDYKTEADLQKEEKVVFANLIICCIPSGQALEIMPHPCQTEISLADLI